MAEIRRLIASGAGVRLLICVAALAGAAACGKDSTPTSPTTTTTTTQTVAAASITETFAGSLPVSGARFYAFDVGAYGTVNLTLDQVGGGAVPTSVWVGLGVGVPDGTDCSTTLSVNTQSGSSAQVSSVLAAGTYCARVYDIGNLSAAVPFSITIAHP